MKSVAVLASLLVGAFLCAAQAAPPPQPASLTGEVLETRKVDSYTYLLLKTSSGEIWAAVPSAAVSKGARVTIARPMMMENFESKTLNKTFDRIAFGVLEGPNATVPSPHGSAPAAKPADGVVKGAKVAKANGPNAKTVAEVVGGKAALKDKPVVVRGQVVKVNTGIMGKNWVHLRDGSGSAADGSNDILVTTQDTIAVGDIVSANGTVRTDVNLGSGYTYAVIIEGATLRK
jgi:hypothetical protein